ncbi:MAG: bifunctional folylpolyglutamate synthase/dihydrofolate synthase [Thermodesulfobacteriota bacterium]
MHSDQSYQQCLASMYALRRFGIKLGLDVITNMLGGLGNPQDTYHIVHVAGSNGKGSISATLAAILQEAGFQVGLYTSPHLVRFNERIRINGEEITDAEVVACHQVVQQVHHGDREPTFFEYTTAMALYEFGRRKVDWAVIETGMGGRLDATNIVRPAVAVISNISLEHQFYLGDTLARIAAEKAGIIKQGIPVVTAAKQKSVREVIEETARKKKAPVYRLGRDFRIRRNGRGGFSYYGLDRTLPQVTPALAGAHQFENTAVALAACEVLMKGTKTRPALAIPPEAVTAGLEKTRWPGRLEILSQNPLVILDGAHNLPAVKLLVQYLKPLVENRRLILVIGILNDKAFEPMLNSILPICGRVILTQPQIDRSLPPEELLRVARNHAADIEIRKEVGQAVKYAVESAGPEDVVCIAGSLYVVGETKAAVESGLVRFRP